MLHLCSKIGRNSWESFVSLSWRFFRNWSKTSWLLLIHYQGLLQESNNRNFGHNVLKQLSRFFHKIKIPIFGHGESFSYIKFNRILLSNASIEFYLHNKISHETIFVEFLETSTGKKNWKKEFNGTAYKIIMIYVNGIFLNNGFA